MSISDFFNGTKAEDWLYFKIPSAQTTSDTEIREIRAQKDYISVNLKGMRIVNVRKGLSKFYGTVHSNISVPNRDTGKAEFKVLTTPGKLQELDASNIDKVISTNIPLLGPVPYEGGRVEMELGLFSIKAVDLTAPVLSLLSNISKLSGVSFVNTATHYLEPLKQGIEILTGSSDKTVLEIGLSTTWDKLVTGNYVIMRVPADKINEDELFLDKEFRLTDENGNSVRDYPYLVFEIIATNHRYDYFNIPDIGAAYKSLQTELRKGDNNASRDALKVFKRLVLVSNDLIREDAKTICDDVEKEVSEFISLTSDDDTTRSENVRKEASGVSSLTSNDDKTRSENLGKAGSELKDLKDFKFFTKA